MQITLMSVGVDVVVVYKIDRLTRSLADFAKLVEAFDAKSISFVAVTQQFNTTTSMGRLTLNVLLSFAQFERELSSERVRDKIAASRRKGKWTGGTVPLGYDARTRSSSSTRPRRRPFAPSSVAISNWDLSASWSRISTAGAWLAPPKRNRLDVLGSCTRILAALVSRRDS
jgi:DNA invertase Pin-like site-specific DNA recombinase